MLKYIPPRTLGVRRVQQNTNSPQTTASNGLFSPAATQQSILKLSLTGTAAGRWSGRGTAKADFPQICVFWLNSLMSNKAQTPSDDFPEDEALIKPLAWSRLSGTCVIFCLSPLVGHTWGLSPLLAALLHKICGYINAVKPFPCLLRLFEVGLKQL